MGPAVEPVEQSVASAGIQPSVRFSHQTSTTGSAEKENRMPTKENAKEAKATTTLIPGSRQSSVAGECVDNRVAQKDVKKKAVERIESEMAAVGVEEGVSESVAEKREQRAMKLRQAREGNERAKRVVSVERPHVEATTKEEKPVEKARATSITGANQGVEVVNTVAEAGTEEIKANLIAGKQSVKPTQEASQGAETTPTETVLVSPQKKTRKLRTPSSSTAEESNVSPMPSEVVVTADRLEKVVKTATKKIANAYHANGMTVSQATSLLTVPELKTLEKPGAQVALLTMAERVGVSHEVHQAVVQEVASNREAVRTIGFTALLKALDANQVASTDIAAHFLPQDFDPKKVKTTLAEVLKEAYEVTSASTEEKEHEQKEEAQPSLQAIRTLVEELSEGKQVGEIVASSALSVVKDMQCLETQMAIVSVLDRLGLGQVTEEVVLEQLGGERSGMLNTVGSRALASTISQQAVTTEQVLACLQPEDLRPDRVQERVANILSFAQTVNTAQVEHTRACYFSVGELVNQASDG